MVNKQLTARGLSQKADSPDLLISYLVGAELTNTDDFSDKVGERTAQQYSEGAILLDFLDAKTRELLWRVAAFGIEDRNPTPERNKEIVEKKPQSEKEGQKEVSSKKKEDKEIAEKKPQIKKEGD